MTIQEGAAAAGDGVLPRRAMIKDEKRSIQGEGRPVGVELATTATGVSAVPYSINRRRARHNFSPGRVPMFCRFPPKCNNDVIVVVIAKDRWEKRILLTEAIMNVCC
uniref:Uncharacterized protein n=1 Tax=Plectus sambesii TaxID=2011161 RepID=A0A914VKL9_9BILA